MRIDKNNKLKTKKMEEFMLYFRVNFIFGVCCEFEKLKLKIVLIFIKKITNLY